MKRDFDLIRSLLFVIETFPPKISPAFDYQILIDDYSKEEINYHLFLMLQAKLIDGAIHRSIFNKHIEVVNETLELTWAGHDFLNAIRVNSIWKQIKSKIKISELPFELIKETAKILIQASIKLS